MHLKVRKDGKILFTVQTNVSDTMRVGIQTGISAVLTSEYAWFCHLAFSLTTG